MANLQVRRVEGSLADTHALRRSPAGGVVQNRSLSDVGPELSGRAEQLTTLRLTSSKPLLEVDGLLSTFEAEFKLR